MTLESTDTIRVVVNGAARTVEPATTVADLIGRMDLEPVRVAVELNEDLVSRARYGAVVLREGDRVEIVTFVGGG